MLGQRKSLVASHRHTLKSRSEMCGGLRLSLFVYSFSNWKASQVLFSDTAENLFDYITEYQVLVYVALNAN